MIWYGIVMVDEWMIDYDNCKCDDGGDGANTIMLTRRRFLLVWYEVRFVVWYKVGVYNDECCVSECRVPECRRDP